MIPSLGFQYVAINFSILVLNFNEDFGRKLFVAEESFEKINILPNYGHLSDQMTSQSQISRKLAKFITIFI